MRSYASSGTLFQVSQWVQSLVPEDWGWRCTGAVVGVSLRSREDTASCNSRVPLMDSRSWDACWVWRYPPPLARLHRGNAREVHQWGAILALGLGLLKQLIVLNGTRQVIQVLVGARDIVQCIGMRIRLLGIEKMSERFLILLNCAASRPEIKWRRASSLGSRRGQ